MTPKEFAAAKHRWLDHVQADAAIGHLTFRLAYVLASYFNGSTADAWPAQTTLAARLSVTRRGVQNCLDQLSACGHLITEMGTGRGNTNRYQPAIKGEPLFALSNHKERTTVPQRANGCSEKGERSFAENSLYEPSIGTFSNTDFEQWFDRYPRKEGKQAAREAYEEVIAKGKATPEQLLSSAEQYAADQDAGDPLGPEPMSARLWLMRGLYAHPQNAPVMPSGGRSEAG